MALFVSEPSPQGFGRESQGLGFVDSQVLLGCQIREGCAASDLMFDEKLGDGGLFDAWVSLWARHLQERM